MSGPAGEGSRVTGWEKLQRVQGLPGSQGVGFPLLCVSRGLLSSGLGLQQVLGQVFPVGKGVLLCAFLGGRSLALRSAGHEMSCRAL